MPLHVLIVGCGYVGTALATRLVAAGHRVTAVRRSDRVPPHGVTALTADVADAATLELPGCDVLVYAVSAGGYDEAAYQRAYVDGVRHTLDALARSPAGLPPLGLFVSSTAVYAQQDGSLVDETSPTEPTAFSGRLLLEGERLVHQRLEHGVAVRLAGIYGPGRTRLLDSVRDGLARLPVEPRFTNRIHRDDCAGVLHHLIERWQQGAPLDPVYLGVDHEPALDADVLRWLAARLGVAEPPAPRDDDTAIPALRSLSQAVPRSATPRRRSPSHKRCSNARLVASGYRFAVPTFREGYDALIRGAQ